MKPDDERPKPRALCVDDEPLIRNVLRLHLQRIGWDVTMAADGLVAWRLIAEDHVPFDVVITDNQMPHMGGVELVERLRAHGYPGHIVFFSSTLPPQSAERLARLQVDAVVEKGQPVADLVGVLRRLRPAG